MKSDSDPVEVAVAIIRDASGRVLVNKRQHGKPFAGKWEFPGGKIEPGESAAQALVRELDEELGISIVQQRPLITFPYSYDDLTVYLRVNEVLQHEGKVSGREDQALDWVAPDELNGIDLLAANAAIVSAVVLPRICLITDAQRFGALRTLELLASHVQNRRILLIVREKTMAPHELAAFVASALDICRPQGSLVCVHADCDTEQPGMADGIHLPARALAEGTLPEGGGLTGASCHTDGEVRSAGEMGADYALLSPVKRTSSHPGAVPLGWSGFMDACGDKPLPVYALGGMIFEDLDDAIEHGAQGVAILSAAWQ